MVIDGFLSSLLNLMSHACGIKLCDTLAIIKRIYRLFISLFTQLITNSFDILSKPADTNLFICLLLFSRYLYTDLMFEVCFPCSFVKNLSKVFYILLI